MASDDRKPDSAISRRTGWLLWVSVVLVAASALFAPSLLAQPSLRISGTTVTEGDAGTVQAVVTIALTPAAGGVVTVRYESSQATPPATGGTVCGGGIDFVRPGGTLSFDAGVTSQTVSVTVCGDTLPESDEKFRVRLFGAQGATIATSQGPVTINDDDDQAPPPPPPPPPAPPVPSVSVDDVSLLEGNSQGGSGSTTEKVTVRLSAVSTQRVTVIVEPVPGSSTATQGDCLQGSGSDYSFRSRTVTIEPGQPDATTEFNVCLDQDIEVNEFFMLALQAPVNATLGDAQGQVLIRNDDQPPPSVTIDVSNPTFVERDADVPASVSVRLSSPATAPVSVLIGARPEGTAVEGVCGPARDYQFALRTVTIPAGQSELAVSFTLCGDVVADGDKTFALGLLNPVNATIGRAVAEFTIQDDGAAGRPNLTVNIDRSPEFTTQTAPRLSYVVEVVNTGDGPASDVLVQSRLPNGVTFVGVENSQMGPCPQSTTDPTGALQVNCTLSSLVAGGRRNVRIVGQMGVIQDGTRVVFGASADPRNNVVEQDEGDNIAVINTTIRAASDLQVTGSVATLHKHGDCPPFPVVSDCVVTNRITIYQLRLAVRNNGPNPSLATTLTTRWPRGAIGGLGGVRPMDDLCPGSGQGFDINSESCVSGRTDPCFDTCAIPALNPGQAVVVTPSGFLQDNEAEFMDERQTTSTVDPDNRLLDTLPGNDTITFTLSLP